MITWTPALTPGEKCTLTALVEAMFPAGIGSPGGTEIGAADYMAAALDGVYAPHAEHYRALFTALDTAASGDFAAAVPDLQRDVMASFEAGTLPGLPTPPDRPMFDLVWRHLREGLFGDPIHGGNKDFAGWTAIGFPGAQFGYGADDQALDRLVDRPPQSLVDLPSAARLEPAPMLRSRPADREHDVVIVGGGMVGGMLASQLIGQGLTVVILEAGPARSGRERAMDEIQGDGVPQCRRQREIQCGSPYLAPQCSRKGRSRDHVARA